MPPGAELVVFVFGAGTGVELITCDKLPELFEELFAGLLAAGGSVELVVTFGFGF